MPTAKAYLQRTRKNKNKPRTPRDPTTVSETAYTPKPDEPIALMHTVIKASDAYNFDNANYSDTTANFPQTKSHFLIMYAYALNYIKVVAINGFDQATYLKAYKQGINDFETSNPNIPYTPTMEVMDNVLYDDMRRYLQSRKITIHLVPPSNHRANNAERAIQTVKKAIVAMLAGAHPDFHMDALGELAPHIEDCINQLRKSRRNPTISAWEDMPALALRSTSHAGHSYLPEQWG